MRGILIRVIAALVALATFDAALAAGHIVNAGGNAGLAFSPQTITIAVGDTVTFVNKGGFHNAVADDHSFRCAHGCDGQPGGNGAPSSSNWVASVTFNTPGSVGYYCEIHGAPGQGMYGTIIVQASQKPPALTSAAPAIGLAVAVLLGVMLALFAAIGLRRRA